MALCVYVFNFLKASSLWKGECFLSEYGFFVKAEEDERLSSIYSSQTLNCF